MKQIALLICFCLVTGLLLSADVVVNHAMSGNIGSLEKRLQVLENKARISTKEWKYTLAGPAPHARLVFEQLKGDEFVPFDPKLKLQSDDGWPTAPSEGSIFVVFDNSKTSRQSCTPNKDGVCEEIPATQIQINTSVGGTGLLIRRIVSWDYSMEPPVLAIMKTKNGEVYRLRITSELTE